MASIGRSVVITGEITSDEDLEIDGQIRGQIHLRETAALTIGPDAQVEADLRGARITVLGTVNGNIAATERIELGASANVTGNLSANHVVLIDGTRFHGRIDMDRRTIAAKVAQYKTEHPNKPR
jgi:cytoskeletal protein CcmA (bactofilin family)